MGVSGIIGLLLPPPLYATPNCHRYPHLFTSLLRSVCQEKLQEKEVLVVARFPRAGCKLVDSKNQPRTLCTD